MTVAVLGAPASSRRVTHSKTSGKSAAAPSGSEQAIAARWLAAMPLRDRIAQLIVIPFSGHPMNMRSREYRKFIHLVAQEHVGGLALVNVAGGRIVGKADPLEVASFINRMQKVARTPLLVGGDFERGASMRVDATTLFPHAMAFTAGGDPAEARAEGEITAREARAVGVQWLFFPDTDVNSNPDNPIINIRSYGENPDDVSRFATAFIEGAHSVASARVLTTAKHFPGHGDTATDTHINLATITGDRERLEKVEWPPFRAAIAAGVDSIMTAHIAVPALDSPDLPATLSPKILTGIVRDEFGFKGIVVTDALEMGGVAHGFTHAEAAVRAIESGVDVLLMPPDPEAAIDGVEAAVRAGKISRKRIDESALRVLTAKAHVGLAAKRLVSIEQIHAIVNAPESAAVAQQIADKSVTLLRNEDNFLPLARDASTAYFILTEAHATVEGQAFLTELRKRAPLANVQLLNASMMDADLETAVQRAAPASRYVVAAFASVAAYRGNTGLGGGFPAMISNLIGTKKPVMLVSLGTPYLLRAFTGVSGYMTTYSTVPTSEIAAVKALFGEIPIAGKLPVTIPDLAKYGDGISLPAVSAVSSQ